MDEAQRRRRFERRTAIALPVVVIFLILFGPLLGLSPELLIGGTLAIPVVIALVHRPELGLRLLIVLAPFHLLVFAAVYRLGVPAPFVRQLGLWKEMVALSLVIAGFSSARRHRDRFDALDRLILGLTALGVLYLFLPGAFASDVGASVSFLTRFKAWREMVLPFTMLVAVRHLRLPEGAVSRLQGTLIKTAAALGVMAMVEFTLADTWNRWMVDTLRVNQYRINVLEVPFTNLLPLDDIRVYGTTAGRDLVRIGGPVLTPLGFAFMLLVLTGPLLERLLRRTDPRTVLALGLVTAGLLMTQTRSAVVGAGLALIVALRPAPGRTPQRRTRFILLAVALLAVAVPLAIGGGLADRLISGDQESDAAHDTRPASVWTTIVHEPMGAGLGLGATGTDANDSRRLVAENQVLDYGRQLGLLGMAMFVATFAAAILTLSRAPRGRDDPGAELALGLRTSLVGLLVGVWYLQPIAFPLSWYLFPLVGVALGATEQRPTTRPAAAAKAVTRPR